MRKHNKDSIGIAFRTHVDHLRLPLKLLTKRILAALLPRIFLTFLSSQNLEASLLTKRERIYQTRYSVVRMHFMEEFWLVAADLSTSKMPYLASRSSFASPCQDLMILDESFRIAGIHVHIFKGSIKVLPWDAMVLAW